MCNFIHGDCLEVMKTFKDNYVSSIVTDPPYGLKFMGKNWDHGIPGVEYWSEALRVTKPGGFLLAFGGTRTYHILTCAIEDAGWEIRDCIMYIYGTGFPKSHNKFGLEGYGTALKPAYEPILVAMKKCDSTFKQNAEKWGQAGLYIDGCRIPTNGEKPKGSGTCTGNINFKSGSLGNGGNQTPELGRWPANIILDEEAGKMLDEQTGILTSGANKPINTPKKNNIYNGGWKTSNPYLTRESNSGGASRFFYCAKASPSEKNAGCEKLDDKIGGGLNATVCGDTRTGNITIQKNNHPTVKPLKLMKYLVKLIAPPKDGLILDPFCGSGSTILACHQLGIESIGIEKEEEYVRIAKSRVNYIKFKNFM